MTGVKLQSDWDMQIPPQDVNCTKLFAQSHQTLFPPQGWGLQYSRILSLVFQYYYWQWTFNMGLYIITPRAHMRSKG
jgi:hypothetical protein